MTKNRFIPAIQPANAIDGSNQTGQANALRHRATRFVAIVLILSLVAAVTACNRAPRRWTHHIIGSFDTVITIVGYNESEGAFREYTEQAEQRFRELHQQFDRYNPYPDVSNVFILNQMAAQKPIQVDQELIDLLLTARQWQDQSSGVVNVALGSVLELWHDTRAQGISNPDKAVLPDPAALEAAAAHTDMDSIQIDADARTVFFTDPSVQLDLGAIAKGYATELVTRELLEAGWTSFIISSGGNVRTTQAPPEADRPQWRIGIQDPAQALQGNEDALLYTVWVTDQSVVTSGDYQRYYTVDGKRYHHVIDPRSLMPADFFASVTIVTPDSGLADFYSTEFFILSYEEGRAYADQLDNVEVLWVFKDGQIEMTEGMQALVRPASSATGEG